jgi:hypothetical protein
VVNNAANQANVAASAPTPAAAKPDPQPPAIVPSVRVVNAPSHPSSSLQGNRRPMAREMGHVKNPMVSQWVARIAAGSAAVVSLLASAASFLWMLRGGSLASSPLSAPVWKSMDPVSVLDNFERHKRRRQRIAANGKSLEALTNQLKVKRDHPSAQPLQSGAEAGKENV